MESCGKDLLLLAREGLKSVRVRVAKFFVLSVCGVLILQAIAQDNMNDVISNIAALIAPEAKPS